MATKATDPTLLNGYTQEQYDALSARGRAALVGAPAAYTAADDTTLNQRATDLYSPQYNAAVQAANNTYTTQLAALQRQINSLAQTYAKSIESSNTSYASNGDTLNGTMLSRGMGRSSYAASLLSNNNRGMLNAANSLRSEQAQKTAEYGDQQTEAATTQANTLARLSGDLQTNIRTLYQQLQDAEYEKKLAADTARAEYYQFLLNKWGVKTKGSSSKSSRSSSSSSSNNTQNQIPTYDYADLAYAATVPGYVGGLSSATKRAFKSGAMSQ